MAWLQLTLHVTAQQSEAASEALEEMGAIAVTLEDAAGEIVIETHWDQTPLWSKVCLSALLPEDTDLAAVETLLMQRLEMAEPPALRIVRVEDQDWAQAWKQHYKPLHMGGRLWVVPSWCEPPDPNAVNVILDPGLAFGTGDHPTTALCLEWLAVQDPSGKIVLDYGCGSGILAIAALKLGAAKAYAVDLDEQSLVVARENAERNGVAERLTISLPNALPDDFQADIVMANILARALIELSPTLTRHTKSGGGLVMSGLLLDQGDMVLPYYRPSFRLTRQERQNWISLSGTRT
ncbi:MAG TPA: 50S ribosomal protein L11 methyltransferase [Burkholderiales bacterium]|nr:50S ribosomal protein L11 methyltransferase [Burkholderiales bacterium]